VQISTSLDEAEALRTEYQQRRCRGRSRAGCRDRGRRAAPRRRVLPSDAGRGRGWPSRPHQQQAAQQQSSSGGGGGGGGGQHRWWRWHQLRWRNQQRRWHQFRRWWRAVGASGAVGPSCGTSSCAPAQYPQPSSLAQVAVNAAMSQQGVPYRYATSLPGVSPSRPGSPRRAHRRSRGAPFEFELIAGGRSNLTFTVTGSDGRRSCCGARRSATCWPRRTTWLASTGSSLRSAAPGCRCRRRSAVHRRVGQRRAVLRDGPRRRARCSTVPRRPSRLPVELRRAGQRAPDRRARRSARPRRRRDRARRPRQARGLRRASDQAVEHPVGGLEDPRAPGHRRGGRRRLARDVPGAAGVAVAHGDYRFGNCLTDVGAAGSPPCSTGSCARSVIRSPTSATWASTGPIPARRRRPPQRPVGGRGVPHLRRAARPVRRTHRSRRVGHRLLRGVLVVAAGRHQRRCVRPLPARGDGRQVDQRCSTRSRRAPTQLAESALARCGGWDDTTSGELAGWDRSTFTAGGISHDVYRRAADRPWWSCTRSPASRRRAALRRRGRRRRVHGRDAAPGRDAGKEP
jgi:hypothetical protein